MATAKSANGGSLKRKASDDDANVSNKVLVEDVNDSTADN